jgi:hypothetical protein
MKVEKKIYEKVELFCSKNSLSEDIKQQIIELCKESYIKGSHDCYQAMNFTTKH